MHRPWRAALVVTSCAVLVACGARVSVDERAETEVHDGGRSVDASFAEANSREGGRVDAGPPDVGAVPMGCPDPKLTPFCPARRLDIDVTGDTPYQVGDVVEPLQVPKYPPEAGIPKFDPVPPASMWDRSDLPEGACVYRLHGISPNCVGSAQIWVDNCDSDAAAHVDRSSIYDRGKCDVVPGCASADPWSGSTSYWWYMMPRGDSVDLVICAPQCAELETYGGRGICVLFYSR